MNKMRISNEGIDLIKKYEGCRLTAYRCPAGVWTIGWGTTGAINGIRPHKNMTITQRQADNMLLDSLKKYEDAVNMLNLHLTQGQFDALVSFCYNLGPNIFKGNLLTALKSGDKKKIATNLLRYDKARVNGTLRQLKGLTRRRHDEVTLFLKDTAPKDDKDLSSAVRNIILSGICLNFNSWKRTDLINLNNVPSLLAKLGGLDRLIALQIISDTKKWLKNDYTANDVRSLLIKYAKTLT